MLPKEKFIKIINEFQSIGEDIEAVHGALKKLDPDFGGFYLSRITNLIVNLLKDVMNDKYEYIDYFIYELDYGRKWKKGMVRAENGTDIKMQTVEDLYDYIKKIHEIE